jgi:Zn-dependent protease with chaperone function
MKEWTQVLGHPAVTTLGWALVHFLWQGAAVAAAAALSLLFLRKHSSQTRYLVACAGLLLAAACLPITWLFLASRPETSVRVPEAVGWSLPQGEEGWLAWLVVGWLSGVTALGLRLCGGWLLVQRLKRSGIRPITGELRQRTRELMRRLRITQAVDLLESTRVQAPMVIGGWRSVVLIPTSALVGMAPHQLEALIAHELAHVRRHDYLVNLLQAVVETVLFYHPAVWWLSRQIRLEREHCCDDLAVSIVGSRVAYARALLSLAELNAPPQALALAGNGGDLLSRMRRLLGRSQEEVEPAPLWGTGASMVLFLLGPLALTPLTPPRSREQPPDRPASVPGRPGAAPDTGTWWDARRDPAPVPRLPGELPDKAPYLELRLKSADGHLSAPLIVRLPHDAPKGHVKAPSRLKNSRLSALVLSPGEVAKHRERELARQAWIRLEEGARQDHREVRLAMALDRTAKVPGRAEAALRQVRRTSTRMGEESRLPKPTQPAFPLGTDERESAAQPRIYGAGVQPGGKPFPAGTVQTLKTTVPVAGSGVVVEGTGKGPQPPPVQPPRTGDGFPGAGEREPDQPAPVYPPAAPPGVTARPKPNSARTARITTTGDRLWVWLADEQGRPYPVTELRPQEGGVVYADFQAKGPLKNKPGIDGSHGPVEHYDPRDHSRIRYTVPRETSIVN